MTFTPTLSRFPQAAGSKGLDESGEDFIISVPYRFVGCSPLPPEIVTNQVEILLYNWEPLAPDTLIGKVTIPFSEVAGYQGHWVDPEAPPWKEYSFHLDSKERVWRHVKDTVEAFVDPGSRKCSNHKVTAAVYFDSSYDHQEPVPIAAAGHATLRLEELEVQPVHKYRRMVRPYVVVHAGRAWVQYPLEKGKHEMDVGKTFTVAVQVSLQPRLRNRQMRDTLGGRDPKSSKRPL